MRTWAVLGVLLACGVARGDECVSNLMIVLDRSCSMNDKPTSSSTKTKWQIAEGAINALVTMYSSKLNVGLIMFPDKTGADCKQDGPIFVNVASGTGSAIASALSSNTPGNPCVTNIDTATAQVSSDPAYPAMSTATRGFILLITDGEQAACGSVDGGTLNAAHTLAQLYQSGYPAYIVGFGGDVDPASLNELAVAGGLPRSGTQKYYQADDEATLDSTLNTIAGQVSNSEIASCAGPPCPDGRCFGAGQVCTQGYCVAGEDGGTGVNDGSTLATPDAGPLGHGEHVGCGCRFTGDAPIEPMALALLVAMAFLLRRRRTT